MFEGIAGSGELLAGRSILTPNGNWSAAMIDSKAQDRFWSKVDRRGPDDCWEWMASKSPKGYGYFSVWSIKRSPLPAHRVSFMIANGSIDDGMFIDHTCRNRSCVNPGHLRQVTPLVNTLENSLSRPYLNTLKTHCPKGHEYTSENTKPNVDKKYPDRPPARICRTCANAWARAKKLKKREEAARLAGLG